MENKNNDKKVINCKFSQIFLEFVALLLVWNDSNSVFLRQLKRNNLKQIRNMKKIRAAVVEVKIHSQQINNPIQKYQQL